MYNSNSPLAHLAAFAIVFVGGVLSTLSVAKYVEKVRRDVKKELDIGTKSNISV